MSDSYDHAKDDKAILEKLRCPQDHPYVEGEAYYCATCERVESEDFRTVLRECSNADCATVFDGMMGVNCDACHRPFTRRLGEDACPDCLDEGALVVFGPVSWCPECSELNRALEDRP